MTTEPRPSRGPSRRAGPGRRRPHPAGASRILATGLAAASAFGLVAAIGHSARTTRVETTAAPTGRSTAESVRPAPVPAPIIVVGPRPSDDRSPAGAAALPEPSPTRGPMAVPVTTPPRRSPPVTRSSSS